MASRISRRAVKSGCACEWGAWGQISEDGPGHYNPDRSEDPWGRAAEAARAEVHKRTTFPDTVRGFNVISDGHEGRWQTGRGEDLRAGKAAPEIPALKPYWGKPTVRNFRGGDGNRGIIRSPQSAIVLPEETYGVPRQSSTLPERGSRFRRTPRALADMSVQPLDRGGAAGSARVAA
jgi:hypothetical protein